MGDQRKGGISWTDQTWNPIRGCSRVSQGCVNCYAESMAARFSGPGQPYEGLARMTPSGARWTGEVRLVEEHLADPLRWKRPRRVFVNSMSDLFHEKLAFEDISAVFRTCMFAERHTFQILTKRPGRMLEYVEHVTRRKPAHGPADGERILGQQWPLPNVWLGVSVEDQKTADERIPLLLQCPAAVRWVSYEPALGPVDFSFPQSLFPEGPSRCCYDMDCGCLGMPTDPPPWFFPKGEGIDWIVVGGESGPHARPFDLAWARSIVEQCAAAGVACFVKQMGSRPVRRDGASAPGYPPGSIVPLKLHDRAGADPAEWPEDLRVQQFPEGLP